MSTVRPNLNAVALVPSNLDDQIASTGFCVLRATQDLLPLYLFFFTRSSGFIDRLVGMVGGAMYPAVSDSKVLESMIPLPPLDEQRRIVDILSRAEGIVRLQKQAADKAREIIPALFIKMFGDPATNPMGWPEVPFGEVGTLDRGKSKHRPRDAAELYDGPYPFIQTGDVARSGGVITTYKSTYSEVGLAQSKLWPAGTLCITIAANIAWTGVLSFDACFPDSVVGFLPGPEIEPAFVQGWLSFLQPTIEANAPQAAQKNINLRILRDLPIPLPPFDIQTEYSRRLDLLRGIEVQREMSQVDSSAVHQTLLHRAFAGQL
ncbi:MAG: restriction endonuclease subunit S [Sedimenticolaceae bacterium]